MLSERRWNAPRAARARPELFRLPQASRRAAPLPAATIACRGLPVLPSRRAPSRSIHGARARGGGVDRFPSRSGSVKSGAGVPASIDVVSFASLESVPVSIASDGSRPRRAIGIVRVWDAPPARREHAHAATAHELRPTRGFGHRGDAGARTFRGARAGPSGLRARPCGSSCAGGGSRSQDERPSARRSPRDGGVELVGRQTPVGLECEERGHDVRVQRGARARLKLGAGP